MPLRGRLNPFVVFAPYPGDMGHHRDLAKHVGFAIDAFERLVTEEAPPDATAMTKSRVVLVQSVNAYIAHLGACVAARSQDTAIAPWRDAHRQVVTLRQSYSEHIGRFNASAIVPEWPRYRASCHHLIAGMREHLHQVSVWAQID